MKKITIVLILFALVLTACQSANAKANAQSTKRVQAEMNTKATSVSLALKASGVVIIVQRSGGVAGVTDQWSFYADGKIVKDNADQGKPNDERTVDSAQVTALLDALKAAGFFDMKISSSIGNLNNCKDCFTYQLTAISDGKTNTITIQEGAAGASEAIVKVIDQLIVLASNP
jgi:hypothetical protein